MRKAAKRARYVIEAAEPALGKKATNLRKRVKKVQSLLGDHHDTVVNRPVLRDLGGRAQLDGGNGFTFGVLHAAEVATARKLEANCPRRGRRSTRRVSSEPQPRGRPLPIACPDAGQRHRAGRHAAVAGWPEAECGSTISRSGRRSTGRSVAMSTTTVRSTWTRRSAKRSIRGPDEP